MDTLEAVRAARAEQDRAEATVDAAVQHARDAGRTWEEIGEALGVSAQAAFQRHGDPSPLPDAGDLAASIIDDLAHARWAEVSARFDATMRDGLSDEELAAGWAQIAAAAGTYRSHGATEVARVAELTTTNTPLTFEGGEFVARITFRDDQTIAGLYILNPDAAAAM